MTDGDAHSYNGESSAGALPLCSAVQFPQAHFSPVPNGRKASDAAGEPGRHLFVPISESPSSVLTNGLLDDPNVLMVAPGLPTTLPMPRALDMVSFADPKHAEYLGDGVAKELIQQNTGQDFTIICESQEFKVHLDVLVCFTGYFSALMRSNMTEAQERRLVLEEVDPQTLKALLSYMYTGRLCLTWPAALSLFAVAMRFSVSPITAVTADYLMQAFYMERAGDLIALVDLYPVDPLKPFLMRRLSEEFVHLTSHPAFRGLSLDLLRCLVQSDSLTTLGEEWLYEQMSAWVALQSEHIVAEDTEVEDAVADLLRLVRYSLVSEKGLERIGCSSLSGCVAVREGVERARQYLAQCQTGHPSRGTLPRLRTPETCIVLVTSNDQSLFDVLACRLGEQPPALAAADEVPQVYRLHRDSTKLYRKLCGVAVMDNFLFVFSVINPGVMDSDRTTVLSRFDPQHCSVTEKLRSMSLPRHSFATAVCGREIFVLGGTLMDGGVTAKVESYNVDTNSWKACPRLTFALCSSAAAGVGSDVYLTGGCMGPTAIVMKSVFRYNTVTRRTSVLQSMNYCRRNHDIAVVQGNIYVVGGIITENPSPTRKVCAEMYDIHTDQWTTVSDYTTMGGSSLGHYLTIPGTDRVYSISREIAEAEDRDVWQLQFRGPAATVIRRWAVLPVSLSMAFTCSLELNFSDRQLLGRLVSGPPTGPNGRIASSNPRSDSYHC